MDLIHIIPCPHFPHCPFCRGNSGTVYIADCSFHSVHSTVYIPQCTFHFVFFQTPVLQRHETECTEGFIFSSLDCFSAYKIIVIYIPTRSPTLKIPPTMFMTGRDRLFCVLWSQVKGTPAQIHCHWWLQLIPCFPCESILLHCPSVHPNTVYSSSSYPFLLLVSIPPPLHLLVTTILLHLLVRISPRIFLLFFMWTYILLFFS